MGFFESLKQPFQYWLRSPQQQQEQHLSARIQHQRLDLSHTASVKGAIQCLAQSECFSTLRELSLEHCALCPSLVEQLMQAPLPQLKRLNLAQNALDLEGLHALTQSSMWHTLESLNLNNTNLNDEKLSVLLQASSPGSLQELYIQDHQLTEQGIQQLARSPNLAQIWFLDLSGPPLCTRSLDALTQSETLQALEELHLTVDEPSLNAQALVQSPYLARLSQCRCTLHATQQPAALRRTTPCTQHLDWQHPKTPLHHKTMTLARAQQQPLKQELLPVLQRYLQPHIHPALQLWSLRLLAAWQCAALFTDQLHALQCRSLVAEELRAQLLEQTQRQQEYLQDYMQEFTNALF